MILRGNGIKTTVVAGIVTHGCVMSTVTDAPFFDYYPVVLRNCVASHTQRLHDAAMLLMSYSKDVVDSKEVLEIWRGEHFGSL